MSWLWCITNVKNSIFFRGLSFSLEGGYQIYKKSASIKLWPPFFGNKNFMTLHHQYTLPPKQAKIVLKSVFLKKINTLSVVILWLTTFWSSKILWSSLFLFPNIYEPQHISLPLPPKKMIAPLHSSFDITRTGQPWLMKYNQIINMGRWYCDIKSNNCVSVIFILDLHMIPAFSANHNSLTMFLWSMISGAYWNKILAFFSHARSSHLQFV